MDGEELPERAVLEPVSILAESIVLAMRMRHGGLAQPSFGVSDFESIARRALEIWNVSRE